MRRRAARVDTNQGEIVRAFRELGFSVRSLAAVGQGMPDLLVARAGRNYLVEVKDGSRPPSEQELTDDQVDFIRTWKGAIHLVNSVDAVLELVEQLTLESWIKGVQNRSQPGSDPATSTLIKERCMKPVVSTQKPQKGATSAAVKYAVGSGSRPGSSSGPKTETSAPKSPQKIRG